MPGNFDNIIREVLNSTQSKPVGDVVPMPPQPKILQDGAGLMSPDDPAFPNSWLRGPLHEQTLPTGIEHWPSRRMNDANLGQTILRG